MKSHFWSLHVCLLSATMVNKSLSSVDLVIKANFANQKEIKISSIWTSQKIILKSGWAMSFSISPESFPEKLSWKNILFCGFQLLLLSSYAVGFSPTVNCPVYRTLRYGSITVCLLCSTNSLASSFYLFIFLKDFFWILETETFKLAQLSNWIPTPIPTS